MIDDLISVTNVNQTPSMNHKINTFIESKKLQLFSNTYRKRPWGMFHLESA